MIRERLGRYAIRWATNFMDGAMLCAGALTVIYIIAHLT